MEGCIPQADGIEARHRRPRAAVRCPVGEADMSGMEVARLVRITPSLCEAIAGEWLRQFGLSDARLGLLVRAYLEEANSAGDPTGPTHSSHHQHLSKNTISALLRGLEEQGLIERSLDDENRRSFRIRLSSTGRSLVARTMPLHAEEMSGLVACLSPDERQQLQALLAKASRALCARVHGLESVEMSVSEQSH